MDGPEEPPLAAGPLRPPLADSQRPRDLEPNPAEIEKIRKWQEERITRRLRGDYESSVIQLSHLIQTNMSSPMRVGGVRVEGTHHTRASFLSWLLEPHVNSIAAIDTQGGNLESALHATRAISQSLLGTDIFSSVEARLEKCSNLMASPDDVDIVFKTREKGKYMLKTATEFGDNEGNASVQTYIRNVFGGAENLEASASLGTRTKHAYNVNFSAPLTRDLRTRGELSIFSAEKDFTSFASCVEATRGLKATIRSVAARSQHEFSYEAALRRLAQLTPAASISIREAAGTALKSSLTHTWSYGSTDTVTPNDSIHIKTFQEVAGLGGSAAFLKTYNQARFVQPLTSNTTLSLSGRFGLIYPLLSQRVHFSDRFQAGGPLDVRMFRMNSLGPKDGFDSLGGDICWSTGISLVSKLPLRPKWPLRWQLFVNAGGLDNISPSQSLSQNIASCLSKPNVSVGVGLLYRLDPVKVELNFGVPLVAAKSDGYRKGLQFGVGLEFL